jgi:hypothetical protein
LTYLTHDEVLEMLQQTLIYKRTPENLRPILMTSVMDLADQMQAEIERRNEQMTENQMQDAERQTMREHIIFLGTQLENERHRSREKTALLRRMLDPEDLGHAVTHEVRKLAYAVLNNEFNDHRDMENKK